MAVFPELVGGLKTFMSGFQHSQKMEIAKLADDAPGFERKGFEDYAFGTGGGDGQVGTREGRSWNRYGSSGFANEPVTLDSAQNLSTVNACRRILCETHAALPFMMVQRKAPGKLTFRDDLPIHNFMVHGNDERSGFGIREAWMAHLIFQGNAYGRIHRRSGGTRTALDIEMLLPEWVQPLRELPYGRLKYVVSVPGLERKTYFVNPGEPQDILHIRGYGYDGLRGYSVLHMARQTLSSGLGMEKNLGTFWARGGRQPYLLTKATKFINNAARDEFNQRWLEKTSDPHRPVLLEGDLTYTQIGLSLEDCQLLESRQFGVLELCRHFGVSPSLVFDLSKANYNSLEQLIRAFINFTLNGWMTRCNSDFRRCVMTPQEKAQNIMPRYDLAGIEKGDFQQRMSGYASMLVNGAWSRNEVREKEGDEPVEGLDGYLVQSQNVDVTGVGPGLSQTADQIESEELDG